MQDLVTEYPKLSRDELIAHAYDAIRRIGDRMTLRQIYYQLVKAHIFENKLTNYKRLSDVLARAREAGIIPWDAMEDRGRDISGAPSVGEGGTAARQAERVVEYLETTTGPTMPVWWHQEYYVEVWLEKQALEGIFEKVTRNQSVVLMPCKGYPSASFLHDAAERITESVSLYNEVPKKTVILYAGDFDPSGKDIERYIREKMEDEHGIDIHHFERICLTIEQIEEENLPPAPTKSGDSRSAAYIEEYGDFAVELDALDPPQLKELVREGVCRFFDADIYEERNEELKERRDDFRELLVEQVQKLAEQWKTEAREEWDDEDDYEDPCEGDLD